ncbi:MAG: hypothetical protein HFJ54_05180 [Clostridia bacterium]|nr:hypothetical protein [Clostridia bacterium]
MVLIKIIAFVIFIIAFVTIYHNTNSFEPKQRIIYIVARNNCNVFYNKYNLYDRYKRNTGAK